jgi:hypothetical protein
MQVAVTIARREDFLTARVRSRHSFVCTGMVARRGLIAVWLSWGVIGCGSTGAPGEVGAYLGPGLGGSSAAAGAGGAFTTGGATTDAATGMAGSGGFETGAPSSCPPGQYKGNYAGTMVGPVAFPLSGEVSLPFVVEGPALLSTSTGLLYIDFIDVPVGFSVRGMLDCNARRFIGTLWLPGGAASRGVIYADYDPKTAAFVRGEWVITTDESKPAVRGVTPESGAMGVFAATFVRP